MPVSILEGVITLSDFYILLSQQGRDRRIINYKTSYQKDNLQDYKYNILQGYQGYCLQYPSMLT